MRPYVSLLGRLGSRLTFGARFFSTSIRQNDNLSLEAKTYVAAFYRMTRNPMWLLVDTLHRSPGRLHTEAALAESQISSRDFSNWEAVTKSTDIDVAIAQLNGNLEVPDWVLSYLVTFTVKTAAQAEGPLLDLVYANLERIPAQMKGPLLVVTTFHLARHNLIVHIPRVVDTFLTVPLQWPSPTFNRLLTALASVPLRSAQTSNIIMTVLKAMDERQIPVVSYTYDKLLDKRIATVQLAEYIIYKMRREMARPTPENLESLHRVFTMYGDATQAKKYLDALRALTDISGEDNEEGMQRLHRVNNATLAGFKTRVPAANFLSQIDSETEVRMGRTIDVQTSALHVLARDKSVDTKFFISEFIRIVGAPTIATYTVLVRGLLLRKEYKLAETFWIKLVKAGWPMDKHALTAGLQAVIRNGKPHEALKILEFFALKPGEEEETRHPDDIQMGENGLPVPSRAKVKITTVTMNEVMAAFNRVARPDVVFRLWDYMGVMYDVRPDALSLSILLQAARIAVKKDDSLSGFLAKLRKFNPLSRHSSNTPASHSGSDSETETSTLTRDAALAELTSLVGKDEPALYRSGIWRDLEPFELARTIFLQAFFGNHIAHMDELLALEPPARAWRMTPEDDAYEVDGYGLGLPQWREPPAYAFVPPAQGLLLPSTTKNTGTNTSANTSTSQGKGKGSSTRAHEGPGRSYYPTVIVTNANCLNYISLLGVGGRAPEIPYVLAWMRRVGIKPSESTLALALAFFHEVTVQAPLVEKWRGHSDSGPDEYFKLREWIVDWVGRERLPAEDKMQKFSLVAKEMRRPVR